MPTRSGSFRLFRLFGITVFLHWSWFVVAVLRYQLGQWHRYSSPAWYALEYVSLFLIVLMHEFGHQLACRSVGGATHDIVLWPLGGVAYVSPPQRPGAQLWSIVAGPLVNVILFPLFLVLLIFANSAGWEASNPDIHNYVYMLFAINTALLVFNLMPVYPLDGGQILRSLLWFVCGRAHSLMIASIVGLIGVAGLIGYAFWIRSVWIGIMCAFILMNCWSGLMQARAMLKMANTPRREGFACPECHSQPPQGAIWRCGKCRQAFDTFETQGACPHCGAQYAATSCPECGSLRPISEWMTAGNAPPRL
jgi:Zn-dependent protease